VLAIGEIRRARIGRGTLLPLIVLASALCAGTVGSYHDRYILREAVVVIKQSAVRFGPLEDSQTAFQLSDGAEIEITDSTAAWLQLRDAGGRVGWVKRDDVTIIPS
jgi:SH3-like domain-containing protein